MGDCCCYCCCYCCYYYCCCCCCYYYFYYYYLYVSLEPMLTYRTINRIWNYHYLLRHLSYNRNYIQATQIVPHHVVFKFQFNTTQFRMAGHNKWSKIAKKKMAADTLRSTMISRFVQKIRRHVTSKLVAIGTKLVPIGTKLVPRGRVTAHKFWFLMFSRFDFFYKMSIKFMVPI